MSNTLIFKAIVEVRAELQGLRDSGASKSIQLECFQRLITLYGALNAEHGTVDITTLRLKAA